MSGRTTGRNDPLTAADAALIAHLAEHGFEVGPRQLKRWRQQGLLAAPLQRSRGRGGGRPSTAYPPEAYRQAEDIARCLGRGIPLKYVALSLFAQDIPVPFELVRKAYLDFLDEMDPQQGGEDPLDRADAVVQKQRPRMKRSPWGKEWIRRSGEYGARRSSRLEDVLMGITGVLFAEEQPSEEAKAATPAIVGAPEDAAEPMYNAIGSMSAAALRRVAETADGAELKRALEILQRLSALAHTWDSWQKAIGSAPLAAGLGDTDLNTRDPAWKAIDALAVAAMLRAFPAFPDGLAVMEEVTREAPRAVESINGAPGTTPERS